MKICCTCMTAKDFSEFNRSNRSEDGYQPRCRVCQQKANASPDYQQVRLAYKLRKRYGLTFETYDQMLDDQGGVCAICKTPPKPGKRLDVDHDHACCPGEYTCGKCLRGLLCRRCNTLLGQASESVSLLQEFIKYLENSV